MFENLSSRIVNLYYEYFRLTSTMIFFYAISKVRFKSTTFLIWLKLFVEMNGGAKSRMSDLINDFYELACCKIGRIQPC